MTNSERHFCFHCGTEQGYVGEIVSYIFCERCGTKIYSDGSMSYDGTQEGIKESKEYIKKYDKRFKNDL